MEDTFYTKQIDKICLFISPRRRFPPVNRAFLPSKLEDGRCRVQSSVKLVNLAVQSFPCFLQNSSKYWLGSLRMTPTEDTPSIGPDPTCGQLALTLQLNSTQKLLLYYFYLIVFGKDIPPRTYFKQTECVGHTLWKFLFIK